MHGGQDRLPTPTTPIVPRPQRPLWSLARTRTGVEMNLPILESELTPLALRYAGRDANLADEVIEHLRVQYWRGLCDATRGSFRNWAATVIRRYCLDARQHRLRAVGCANDAFPERVDCRPDLQHAELELDLDTPFGVADLHAIRNWTPRQQVVLLGWTGLFGKLPAPDRRATRAAERIVADLPVPGFLTWRDADRTAYLAAALRVKPNTVNQVRHRDMHRLTALRFVRGLQYS